MQKFSLIFLFLSQLVYGASHLQIDYETKLNGENNLNRLICNKENKYLLTNFLNEFGLYSILQNEILNYLGYDFTCIKTINTHTDSVEFLYPVSDNLICCLCGGRIKTWDIDSCQCVDEFKKKKIEDYFTRVAIDKDILIYSTYSDQSSERNLKSMRSIRVSSLSAHETMLRLTDPAIVNALLILKNGNLAASYCNQVVKIWNIHTGNCIRTLEGYSSCIKVLCELPNGDLISGEENGIIRIWDIDLGSSVIIANFKKCIQTMCLLPNNQLAVGVFGNSDIKIFDITSPMAADILINSFIGHLDSITKLVLFNENLVSASNDKTIKIWDINSRECLFTLNAHDNCVKTLCVHDNFIVSGSDDGTIKIWSKTFDITVSEILKHISNIKHESSRCCIQ